MYSANLSVLAGIIGKLEADVKYKNKKNKK